jgi:hypothetical protein
MFARRREHIPGRQGKTWPYEKSTGDSDIEVVEVSSVPSLPFSEESKSFDMNTAWTQL